MNAVFVLRFLLMIPRTNQYRLRTQSAFTLVELAIVLAIVGLLVGGVLVGRDLIQQAEYRSQIAEIVRLKTAHMAFRDKYQCIPGDCANTSRFFPTTNPAYNGNGDGMVQCWLGAPYVDECKEYFYTMVLAGLIHAEPYIAGSPEYEYYKGKLKNSVMYVHYTDRYGLGSITGSSAAMIHLVKINPPWAFGGIFTPEDAKQLDDKFDDGLANKGALFGLNGGDDVGALMACLNVSNNYDLSQTIRSCRMDYKID